METLPWNELMGRELQKAKEAGIGKPVFLTLSSLSPQARRLYEASTGREMQSAVGPDGEEYGPMCVESIPVVAAKLRAHAGPGGDAVARHLEDESIQSLADFWSVVLLRDSICFGAFREGKRTLSGQLGYETPARKAMPPGEVLNDEGPSRVGIELEDGKRMLVYGATGIIAAMAATLAAIVYSGKMTLEHEGQIVRIDIGDDALAKLLGNVYSDNPQSVAEAITALKQTGTGKENRLLRVLRNRPSLHELNKATRRELTGV